jgi:4-hydroxybenzoate polyprenyltransferase
MHTVAALIFAAGVVCLVVFIGAAIFAQTVNDIDDHRID